MQFISVDKLSAMYSVVLSEATEGFVPVNLSVHVTVYSVSVLIEGRHCLFSSVNHRKKKFKLKCQGAPSL